MENNKLQIKPINTWLLVGYVAIYVSIHLIFSRLNVLRGVPLFWVQSLSYIVLGISGLFLFRWFYKEGLKAWRVHFLTSLLWLIGALVVGTILENIAAIPAALLNSTDLGGNTVALEAAFKSMPVLLILFSLGICGPIVEETLFRLLFLGVYPQKRFASFYILLSTILFMLIHLKTFDLVGLANVLPQFAIGLVYATVYYKTKNITIPLFLHILNNTLGLMMI